MKYKPIRGILVYAIVATAVFPLSLFSREGVGRCVIKSMVGTVKVRKGKEAKWLDARMGMPLREADAIRTFLESTAEIETPDGSMLNVGENSTVEMSSMATRGDDVRATKVKILNGNLMANVKKLTNAQSKFDFETPTAVASIRGTRVGFDVSSEKTDIRVYEGKVLVIPIGSETGAEVGANQMTSVERGQKTIRIVEISEPAPVKRVPAKETDTLASDTGKAAPEADTSEAKPADTAAAVIQPLLLSLSSPREGATFKPEEQIIVQGKVTPPGARVMVQGKAAQVSSSGEFRIAVSAPKEPGDYSFSIDAAYENQSKSMIVNYSVIKAQKTDFKFVVTQPAPAQILAGQIVAINGAVVPGAEVYAGSGKLAVSADGSFSGQVNVPDGVSEFELVIEASFDGASKSISRTVYYKPELKLAIISPVDGQKLSSPMVILSGTVSPAAADVSVSGVKVSVKSNGSFSHQIPLPDEESEIHLEIEAAFAGKSVSVSRTVSYKPSLKLVIFEPKEGQEFSGTQVRVSGTVSPATAQLQVEGAAITVMSNGSFSRSITVPETEEELDIEFEATSGSQVKSEIRRIKRAADTFAPTIQPASLPLVSSQKRLTFTVMDRTPNDEITFYREIDGSRDSESGKPGTPFVLELEDGIHHYAVYAEDKAGNRSPRVAGKVSYLSSLTWRIRIRKPAGGMEDLRLPPAAPGGSFAPRYTIEFSIENLPDDEPALIQEIFLVKGNAIIEAIRNPVDVDFDFDVEVRRNESNVFQIKVRDVNNIIRTETVSITVR